MSSKAPIKGEKHIRKTEPSKSIYYQLDLDLLKEVLGKTHRSKINKTASDVSDVIIQIPNSDGGFDDFRVKESSILELAYQKKHPELRTYTGQNINNPSSIISFSITPKGLHAMTLSSKNGTQFIDPYTQDNTYLVYKKGDLPRLKKEFQCLVPDDPTIAGKMNKSSKSLGSDRKLRTFRLAIASTVEYSEFHWKAAGLSIGDSEANKKAAVLAAMVVTMNRVNTIFQRDLAVKMEIVSNNDAIIFINSDSFTNNDADLLIDESQDIINTTIGSANYDIGHTFSTGAGGLASLNSPCVTNRKAMGVTGSGTPVGDAYDIDYVAHEIGHQFGAPHTFNGDTGSCAGGNRSASNAYEPGSGSTIMAYAGICSPQNVQPRSDAYFHQKSIQMMWDNIFGGLSSTCGVETALANRPPVAIAGPDYTIPVSTAYKLVGNSTDPDGTTTHTYTWEQYDLGPAGLPLETNTLGPLVRSFEGTTSPNRYIPTLADYIATGGSTTWEKLPSVERTMTFALTVRDNDVVGPNGGGQTDVDSMTITVVNTSEPFSVINPISWAQGSSQTVEWSVGETANAITINCQTVNILLSTDGGLTFPITLASGVPNNGSNVITVPAEIANTNEARILIEAADNIFYDVSDINFIISGPDFFINNAILTPISCNETTAIYNFDYLAISGFSESTLFSASGLPGSATVTFSPSSLSTSGNVTMTINNLEGVTENNYNITITGTAPSKTENLNVSFPFFNSLCASVANTAFETSTTSVEFNTINQTSGKPSGYSDYTSTTTDIEAENTYNLTVKVNTDGDWTTKTKVWIDWNQNCSFNDAGEEYDLGNATNVIDELTNSSPLPITVPNDAVIGNTTMRVSTKYFNDGVPTPCENNFDGEVEDYTLNITPTLSVEEYEFENFIVYPNPSTDKFTIKLKSSELSDIQTEIYDIRGRMIFNNNYVNSGDFKEEINLKDLQPGVYLLVVSNNSKRSTKKIMIK